MSLAAVPSDIVKVYDPRIDVLKEREYVITKGAQKVSYIPYKSLSTGSSSMSFNVIPPSRNTFVDRKMFIETTISLTFSVTVPANTTLVGNIVDPLQDAPRAFPLSRALASATATIGNTNVSMQTGDVIDALLRVMKKEDLKDFNDGCPTALDRSQTYESYIAAPGNNVLANYSQPILSDGEYARGFFNVTVGALQGPGANGANPGTAGVNTQTVTFHVFEPVMLSPFVFTKMNHSSLIGLQNITLVYNFSQNSELVWSGTRPQVQDAAGARTYVDANVNVNFAPIGNPSTDAQLWVGYYSPSNLMEIPKQVSYNFYEVQRFLSNGFSAMSYGNQQTLNSNNIQLKVIPSLILCGVRRIKGNQRYWQPDCYFQIEKANINFANTVGILSSASPHNLYQISKKNGLNYNYNEWVGEYGSLNANGAVGANTPSGTGSLLVLRPGEDFGLQDAEAPGLTGAFNLQVSLNVKCIDPTAAGITDFEMFIIVVNEGQVSIDVAGTGSTITNIGCVSEADVLKAEARPNMDYNNMKGLVGGDFLGTLSNWARKGADGIHTIAKVAPALLPNSNVAKYASMASDGLRAVGMGRGGELVGSALASKRSLKDRLK